MQKSNIKYLPNKISNWIKWQVDKAGANGVVIGLSGGLDSSVVAVLSRKALGKKVLGIIMPCHSVVPDEKDTNLLTQKFNIRTKRVILDSIYDIILKTFPSGSKICRANLKPRLRMMVLYYFANKLNYLVVGTGNKSELIIGYFTKYGDGGVDILPLGGLLKTQVMALAKELKIPASILKKVPSGGLWKGQTDEGEIGISYEKLDKTILAIESGNLSDIDIKIIAQVKRLMQTSKHKRLPIPIFQNTEL
ncbi:NAD+ synthase [candidate division WOR-3 bacterium]|nr:NAD+ synthase [candidate division WOR-3 bacterium]